MLFWVIVKDKKKEIVLLNEPDARSEAKGGALYGPFSDRKKAKGCVCDLQSDEKEINKLAEDKRVNLKETPAAPAASGEAKGSKKAGK